MSERRQPVLGRRLRGRLPGGVRWGDGAHPNGPILLAIAISAEGRRQPDDPVLDAALADALADAVAGALAKSPRLTVVLDHAGPAAAAWSVERPVGADDVPEPSTGRRPIPLDDAGWERVASTFASAAGLLRARGVPYVLGVDDDGLLHTTASPLSARLPAEVRRRRLLLCHAAAGQPDVALVVEDLAPQGLDPQDGIELAASFADAGARRIYASAGNERLPALKHRRKGQGQDPEGFFLDSAAWLVGRVADVEVHAVGRCAAPPQELRARGAKKGLCGIWLWALAVAAIGCTTLTTAPPAAPIRPAPEAPVRDAATSGGEAVARLFALEPALRARLVAEGRAAASCIAEARCGGPPASLPVSAADAATLLAINTADSRARRLQAAFARTIIDDATAPVRARQAAGAARRFEHRGQSFAVADLPVLLRRERSDAARIDLMASAQSALRDQEALHAEVRAALVDAARSRQTTPARLISLRAGLPEDALRSLCEQILATASEDPDLPMLFPPTADSGVVPEGPRGTFAAVVVVDPPSDVRVLAGAGATWALAPVARAAAALPPGELWDPMFLEAVGYAAARDHLGGDARKVLTQEALRFAAATLHALAPGEALIDERIRRSVLGNTAELMPTALLPSCDDGACGEHLLALLLSSRVRLDALPQSAARFHDDAIRPVDALWPAF